MQICAFLRKCLLKRGSKYFTFKQFHQNRTHFSLLGL